MEKFLAGVVPMQAASIAAASAVAR